MAATIAASAMHWGGAFFSIALGHISDTVFHGSRWQTILMGFLVSTAGLLIIYFWGLRILMLPGGVVILGALLFFAGVVSREFRLPSLICREISWEPGWEAPEWVLSTAGHTWEHPLQESRWAP